MSEPGHFADLVAAWGDLHQVKKTGHVNAGQRKYTHLEMAELIEEIRGVFARHRLAFLQKLYTTDTGQQCVETTLIHATGGVIDSTGPLLFDGGPNPQAYGSASSYAARYQLSKYLGIAGEDDDGMHATSAQDRQRQEFAQTRPVTREAPDPADDPYYVDREPPPVTGGMAPFTEDMPASQKQKAAIHAIMAALFVAQPRHAEFLLWLLRRDSPDRPADLTLSKGDASKVIELLKGDQGKPLAEQFLGAML